MSFIQRMFLSEIAELNLLSRKDIRSIRRWCKIHHVEVYKDSVGEFVIKAEFQLAYDWPTIQKLKGEYGNDWQTYYGYYLNEELYKMIDTNSSSPSNPSRYVAKGRIAKQQ